MVGKVHEQRDSQVSRSEWVYNLQVTSALPVVNLDATMLARLLPQPQLERFYALMSAKYARVVGLFRIAFMLVLIILFIPQAIGRWLTIPAVVLALPVVVLSLLMSSLDLMKLLLRQFEFWFFTIMNTINWLCLASFFSDVRALSLLGGVAATQLVIVTDSNFRTIAIAMRSALAAGPFAFLLPVAVFFRFIDTPESNYRVISVTGVDVQLADIFANTSITIAIFISRKAYLRRALIHASGESLKAIRCVVVRARLQVKSQPLIVSSPTSATLGAPSNSTRTESHQQPLTLVPLTLPSIDVRDLVRGRLSRLEELLSRSMSLLLCFCGVVGSVSTAMTLTHRPSLVGSQPSTKELYVAVASIVFTLIFFCCFAASFHRALAKSLLRNFDFLFTSVQFTLSMLLVSDMMQWDFRAMGAFAWLLWFHLVLFLDTLTPPIKRSLRFQKIYLLPVVVATLAGIVFIIDEFFFTDSSEDFFQDRTLLAVDIRGHPIALRTKSLLINRLITVLLWSCRLMWEVAVCPEDELTFIRGHLEYYTPLPMFPSPQAKTTPTSASETSSCRSRKVVHHVGNDGLQ